VFAFEGLKEKTAGKNLGTSGHHPLWGIHVGTIGKHHLSSTQPPSQHQLILGYLMLFD
jgi:hypothetical protein